MKDPLFLLTLSIIFIASCQAPKADIGIAADYFPSKRLLEAGVVNKYYQHNQSSGNSDISTHIVYRSYQLKGDTLFCNHYDPDYRKTASKQLYFKNDQELLLEEIRYFHADTIPSQIQNNVIRDWKASASQHQKTIFFNPFYYGDASQNWHIFQEATRDTLVIDKPAKIIEGHQEGTFIWNGDTTKREGRFKDIFVSGIGLYAMEVKDSTYKYWWELVAQIPLATFKQQANHGRHRVAYIDPTQTLDKDNDFQLCDAAAYIADYYNGEQKLHYQGGKKAIWQIVNQHLDKVKLFQESGYLTFRFVVNCKGEIGRFVTEQADLDFNIKQFNEATITHLYNIMQKVKDWIPVDIRGKKRDGYFYLTFKLKDGELIELLP